MTGPNFRKLRESRGMGRKECAKYLSIGFDSLKRFENGSQDLTASNLGRIERGAARLRKRPVTARRICPHKGCGKLLSIGASACRQHWQDGMSPRRYEEMRAKRKSEFVAGKGASAFIGEWGSEIRMAVSDNLRAYGVMAQCRRCSRTCKQPAAPTAVIRFCPAMAGTEAAYRPAFAQLKSAGR